MRLSFSVFFIALTTFFLVACGGGGGSSGGSESSGSSTSSSSSSSSGGTVVEPPEDNLPDGRLVYMEPIENGNTFACAYCHALSEPGADEFTRPGHPIGDAPRRPSFKNSALPNFIDAVNVCLDTWMAVPTPWTEETPEFQALEEFLMQQDSGSGTAPTLEFAKADPLSFASNAEVQGDADAGRETFNRSCALCHAENAEGTERAPAIAGRFEFEGAANFIARKVRLSGPTDHSIYQGESVGGRMPFWAADRINDQELEDIIAFLLSSDMPVADDGDDMGGDTVGRDCPSTHPKIGQIAELTTRAHGVTGTATIIDDCTIQFTNFNFDGGGIDVRVYGGIGAGFSGGFAMGENLVNRNGYSNTAFNVNLPEGSTLDDLDRISIWCIPVAVSFGDGAFQ